jgi:choline dehydrogenase-like flavoprotein
MVVQGVPAVLPEVGNQVDNTNPTAGKGGPITVVNAKDTGNPVSQVFLDACAELGYPLVDDFNTSHFGAGWHHLDMKEGRRGSVLTSYPLPALSRGNVTLQAGARATKLVLETAAASASSTCRTASG